MPLGRISTSEMRGAMSVACMIFVATARDSAPSSLLMM